MKRVLALVLIAIVPALIAGCGQNKEASKAASDGNEALGRAAAIEKDLKNNHGIRTSDQQLSAQAIDSMNKEELKAVDGKLKQLIVNADIYLRASSAEGVTSARGGNLELSRALVAGARESSINLRKLVEEKIQTGQLNSLNNRQTPAHRPHKQQPRQRRADLLEDAALDAPTDIG